MEIHNLRRPDNDPKNFLHLQRKGFKIDLGLPIGYNSYSDNDISDKISNTSDFEETNRPIEIINSIQNKPFLNNNFISNNFIRFNNKKNNNKINSSSNVIKINNIHKNLNLNNLNNNFRYMKNISGDNFSNKFINSSNEKYMNNYKNRKIILNKPDKVAQIINKLGKIKNNKKKKDFNINDNEEINYKQKHSKYKSSKSINDKSDDFIEDQIEQKEDLNTKKTYNNNNLYFDGYIGEENKMINYNNYFILNKSQSKINHNLHRDNIIENRRRSSLYKSAIPYTNYHNISNNLNKYQNNNILKENKSKGFYICLRNSLYNNENDLDYENYFSNSHEYFDNNTLNPKFRYSQSIIENIYNPKSIHIPKLSNTNTKKFSKTFIDIKDIGDLKENNYNKNEIINYNEKKNIIRNNQTENLIISKYSRQKNSENSQQKSYKKKLLNNNRLVKKEKIIIDNKNKRRDLSIKTGFEKNILDNWKKHAHINSSSFYKPLSPLASNPNNNLINTEKISHNKYGKLKNKIDIKKKISFNNTNSNTITTSKTITKKKNNNMIIPPVQNNKNKIVFIRDFNKFKDKKQLIIYKKRKISNQKYQSKIKKKCSNTNSNINLKNYFTDIKQMNNDIYNIENKNIRKVNLFKSFSKERDIEIKNRNNSEKKLSFHNHNLNSKSDNSRINNYIKKNINNKNKCKIYMKGILKKWKINAKINTDPLIIVNSKVVNSYYNFKKKFYNFYIKKNNTKICFLTKRYKIKIPINKLCVYSKNIILKKDQNIINNNEDKNNLKEKKNNSNNSLEFNIIINEENINYNSSNDKKDTNGDIVNEITNNNNKENNDNKIDINNNINKNIEMLEEEDEENENEDFKIEEYEEKHINSIMNLNKNTNSIINSNSSMNINNIIIEEKNILNNNLLTIGKEIQTNSEVCSLANSKISLPKKEKNFRKIEAGLEKLCRIFFRNLERKNKENNLNESKMKKEKSDSNIDLKKKSKYSALFSSTIQNWNDIDKKYYENEDNSNELEKIVNFQNKKNRKNKKYIRLINLNKAFSEEKIREQGDIHRRTLVSNSKIILEKKNNINNNQIIEKTNPINKIDKKVLNNNIINDQKQKYTELLNILSVKNYTYIFGKILNLINNENDGPCRDINSFELLLNNQFIFVEVIVDKAIKEKFYMALYAKLCKDLYLNLISNFICINKKKKKGENLKTILSSECKQKFDECDIITLMNLEKNKFKDKENMFENIKSKLIGIIDFLCEIINSKMISQKMGLEYLDILHKRIINFDNDIKNYEEQNYLRQYKNLYIQGEVNLLEKLSIIISERNKPKHVQNLKNFIEDNIIPIMNNKSDEISNYLICKIINLLEKLRNKKPFNDIKQIKIEDKTTKNNNNIIIKNDNKNNDINKNINNSNNNIILLDNKNNDIQNINININKNIDETLQNMNLLKTEIENYFSFLSKNKIEKNNNKILEINDEFNWSIVDNFIIKKNIPLETIIYYYIKICIDIINDKSIIFKANEYIKAVINYYSYDFSNEKINSMHSKMIELFLDINRICINNMNMYEIMGFLLFMLLNNEYKYKFFYIKDLNIFTDKDINTQINIAKVVKFTIIFFKENWKKYYNIFKKTNLFNEGNIFNNYITNPLKLDGFKI